MLLDDQGLQERVARMEMLLGEIEALEDPNARSKAAEVVQVLLELYGEGLARMMDTIAEGEEREKTFDAFAGDELISHLLLLHGLHPLDVETRVVRALEEVRPYLQSHGGNVELLGVEGGVARLRMQGSCSGCPSSTMTLKLAIEEAIQKAAPDLEGIEAEGVVEEPKPAPTIVAGPTLRKKEKKRSEENGASWTVVGGLPQLSGGGLLVKEISGEPVLFLKLRDDFYAYRDLCPGCGESLEGGSLNEAELSCPGCGRSYEVRRAGKCVDDPQLHLEPIPLLVNEVAVEERQGRGQRSIVKIALPSVVG
ncbi:MAG TPA: NifU family protein [Rubrobacter sp.]|jgi:Fe-S cluster biogenesis protein NfuA/nitrite reductase/ring-hydroxylating ferredoxin subunit|nr:NifU family protein [Rubrobacter sp.]